MLNGFFPDEVHIVYETLDNNKIFIQITMSLTSTMLDNGALPTNAGLFVKPSNMPEGAGDL